VGQVGKPQRSDSVPPSSTSLFYSVLDDWLRVAVPIGGIARDAIKPGPAIE
jgi:hypothetical protein